MKYAIVDVGSNTVRMNIYRVSGDAFTCLISKKATCGLGALRDKSDSLTASGIDTLCDALADFLTTARAIGVEAFRAFATASLRGLRNTSLVLSQVKSRTGVELTILTGQEEARLDALAVSDEIGASSGLMIDMGGGSTELAQFKDGVLKSSHVLELGSLYLYRRFVDGVLPSKSELKKIGEFTDSAASACPWLKDCARRAFLIGGTARAANKLCLHTMGTHAAHPRDLSALCALLNDKRGFMPILKVCPDRIHTALPGITALHTLLKRAGVEFFTLHSVGIREGFLKHYVINKG